MAVQPDEVELGTSQHTLYRVGGRTGAQRQPELLFLCPGRHRPVRMRVHPGSDPDEHALMPRGQRGQARDLRGAVDHDASHAITESSVQIRRRFGVPVQDHAPGGEGHRLGDGYFTSRADIKRQAFLIDPLGHRAAQERLTRVGDFRIRQSRGVGLAAVPDVGLVHNEGRSAVPRGQRAQP